MDISIEEARRLLAQLAQIKRINRVPFDKIRWLEKGEVIQVSQEIKDEFKFTGLSNLDFVRYEFYKGK